MYRRDNPNEEPADHTPPLYVNALARQLTEVLVNDRAVAIGSPTRASSDPSRDSAIRASKPWSICTHEGRVAIALDEDFVYWLSGHSLMRCAKRGCDRKPTELAAERYRVLDRQEEETLVTGAAIDPEHTLAVDATSLYWVDGHTLIKLTPR